jgi:hypothetical protein
MNILLLASHAVAEYDDVRMFHDLGYGIFAPGGYEDPGKSGEGIRPALPQVPRHDDLIAACQEQRERFGEPGRHIDWAKARLHPDVIEWADVIIAHHFIDPWLTDQWDAIKHKRVIWRTCGQSNPELERTMTPFVDDGLQVVRYSPAEERFFGNHGAFAGQHALIRFGKYPDDYGPWNGFARTVGNVTQDFMARGEAVGYPFWLAATEGLPTRPVGKGAMLLPSGEPVSPLPYQMMLDYLKDIRAYLYCGTRPASYTLALIEAMLSGVPVVSIGPNAWGAGWGGADLFEAHEFAYAWSPSVEGTRMILRDLLDFHEHAENASRATREMAIAYFGIERIGQRWKDFLEGRPLSPEPKPSHFESERSLA